MYHGHGILIDDYSNIYDGEFSEGKFHGFGQYNIGNDMYIGEFKDGRMEGKGLYKKNMKDSKECKDSKDRGSITDDILCLNGLLKYLNTNKINGSKSCQVNDIYDGEFMNNKREGKGILVVLSFRFEGIFQSDDFLKGRITYIEKRMCIYCKIVEGELVLCEEEENMYGYVDSI